MPARDEKRKAPRGLRELDALDTLFAGLDHPARRHVLQVLFARGGTMTAGELAARFAHSWPTTTRHLGVLEDAGLVIARRQGRERHYSLDAERLRGLLDLWLASVGLAATERASGTENDHTGTGGS
jgi:DNA-binding transcriptional ArsR family regulator